jgi:nitrogen fixation protein NifZ
MIGPEEPQFRWGQPVQTVIDLFNDGSYPNLPADALIVTCGEIGEVVQVGAHVESNTTVYMIEFTGNRVVGCLQDEIEPARNAQPALSQESPTS